MPRFCRVLAVCLTAVLVAWSAPLPAPHGEGGLTTVLVVRHAERGPDEGIESPITEKGRERAQELARVAKEAGITKIVVSEFIRTRQTAEPVAQALQLDPETIKVQSGVADLVKRIRELKGETILVVSHAGRVEPLLEQLGGWKIPRLGSTEYDNLFVLTLPESGSPRMIRLRYGAP